MIRKLLVAFGVPILVFVVIGIFSEIVVASVDDIVLSTIIVDGVIMIGLAVFIYIVKGSERLRRVVFDSREVVSVLVLFAACMAVWFASQFIGTWIWSVVGDASYDSYSSSMSTSSPALLFLLTVVLAPASEELLYRGVVFQFFSDVMSPVVAAVLSSVVFALAHGTVVHIPGTFAMGMFACAVYWRTGFIMAAVGFHSLANLSSYLFTELYLPVGLIENPVWLVIWVAGTGLAVWSLLTVKIDDDVVVENDDNSVTV